MRSMTFRGMRYGSAGPDVVDRRLRTSDLPIPTSNAQADRTTRDRMIANHRGLLRVNGFGDGEQVGSDQVAAGGAATAGFELGMGSGLGRAVLVGVGVTVGASLALRFIDRVWGRR